MISKCSLKECSWLFFDPRELLLANRYETTCPATNLYSSGVGGECSGYTRIFCASGSDSGLPLVSSWDIWLPGVPGTNSKCSPEPDDKFGHWPKFSTLYLSDYERGANSMCFERFLGISNREWKNVFNINLSQDKKWFKWCRIASIICWDFWVLLDFVT